MGIWNKIHGYKFIQELNTEVWRVVEDQARSTTRKLVDTLEEHEILESIIDKSKPKIVLYNDENFFKGLHYLLSTPFRYPPLRHGSRFGTKIERNILYASSTLSTALSEIAYYKLLFLHSSEGKISGNTKTYTAFRIKINCEKFIDLSEKPFNIYADEISSKMNYEIPQKLGTNMRQDGIESFQYNSARDPYVGKNMGVFTPKCLQANNELEKTFQSIKCYYTKKQVEFSYPHVMKSLPKFYLDMYLVDGVLPQPSI